MSNSPYYKDTGKNALASQLSVRFREKMLARFMANMDPNAAQRVLLELRSSNQMICPQSKDVPGSR